MEPLHSHLSLPGDVITILAEHVDHDTMLALLAARPDNVSLVRALYSPNSMFWHRRIGAHTGKGCLVTDTGVPAAVKWTLRDQHNTIIPRCGYLALQGWESTAYLFGSSSIPTTAITNVRIKGVVVATYNTGRQHYKHVPSNTPYVHTLIVALWSDGRLRYISTWINTKETTNDYLTKMLEDPSSWSMAMSADIVPDPSKYVPTDPIDPVERDIMRAEDAKKEWTPYQERARVFQHEDDVPAPGPGLNPAGVTMRAVPLWCDYNVDDASASGPIVTHVPTPMTAAEWVASADYAPIQIRPLTLGSMLDSASQPIPPPITQPKKVILPPLPGPQGPPLVRVDHTTDKDTHVALGPSDPTADEHAHRTPLPPMRMLIDVGGVAVCLDHEGNIWTSRCLSRWSGTTMGSIATTSLLFARLLMPPGVGSIRHILVVTGHDMWDISHQLILATSADGEEYIIDLTVTKEGNSSAYVPTIYAVPKATTLVANEYTTLSFQDPNKEIESIHPPFHPPYWEDHQPTLVQCVPNISIRSDRHAGTGVARDGNRVHVPLEPSLLEHGWYQGLGRECGSRLPSTGGLIVAPVRWYSGIIQDDGTECPGISDPTTHILTHEDMTALHNGEYDMMVERNLAWLVIPVFPKWCLGTMGSAMDVGTIAEDASYLVWTDYTGHSSSFSVRRSILVQDDGSLVSFGLNPRRLSGLGMWSDDEDGGDDYSDATDGDGRSIVDRVSLIDQSSGGHSSGLFVAGDGSAYPDGPIVMKIRLDQEGKKYYGIVV